MKNIIKLTVILLLVQMCVSCFGLSPLKEQPNILFIHVDQMHWQAMSAYGNSYVKTPAMDRLAAEGYSFRAAYATMPQCCPARASWYTGRMSCETGVPTNGEELRPDIPDLGQWLTKHGDYKAAYAGKWHIPGRDVGESFDLLYGKFLGKGEYMDGAVARACMGFLENYKDDKPFFLNAGFMNPHDCCYTGGASGGQGKFQFAREIDGELPPLPINFTYNPKYVERLPGWGERDWRWYIYSYYRWVEMVDAEIGSLFDALKNSRFADNTIVIFAADHGDGLAFHGNISKGYLEDEAWRVPTIIVDPRKGMKGWKDEEHLSIGVDIAATICDYAQVPMMPKMTIARSLRPLVEGKKGKTWRDYIVGESFHGSQVAVRDQQYKTIFYCNNKATKVFDMKADPLEMNNLATSPEGKAVRARHKVLLGEYLDKVEVYEPQEKNRGHVNYLKYYGDFEKNMEQETILNTTTSNAKISKSKKNKKKTDYSFVPNSFAEPCAIEPITGYLPTFSPQSGKSMNGNFTAHYTLQVLIGADEKSKNKPFGSANITFDNGQCRTIEIRSSGNKKVSPGGSVVKTTMQLTGKNNTITQWETESGIEGKDDVKFIEKGTWNGRTLTAKAKSWSRQCTTSNPLIHRWALLPVLASGSIKKAPLVFDMLDDSALRPNQTLRYEGKIEVPVKGGEVKMDSYVQTGHGILPIHYLVDNKGQVQLITMDAVSWALTAK
jgi:choline-sulfatase